MRERERVGMRDRDREGMRDREREGMRDKDNKSREEEENKGEYRMLLKYGIRAIKKEKVTNCCLAIIISIS